MSATPPSDEIDVIGDEADTPEVDDAGVAHRERRDRLAWSALFAIATLAIGAMIGYQLGARHARTTIVAAIPASSSHPAPTATTPADSSVVLQMTNNRCSAQVGSTLQLGVEIRNTSTQAVVLKAVRPVALGGTALTIALSTLGNCGQNPQGSPTNYELAPGDTVWLRGTFAVHVPCPQATPVQFAVTAVLGGTQSSVQLPAFNDLGDVPFSGCPSS